MMSDTEMVLRLLLATALLGYFVRKRLALTKAPVRWAALSKGTAINVTPLLNSRQKTELNKSRQASISSTERRRRGLLLARFSILRLRFFAQSKSNIPRQVS
jgi:hypothetical protein